MRQHWIEPQGTMVHVVDGTIPNGEGALGAAQAPPQTEEQYMASAGNRCPLTQSAHARSQTSAR